VLALRLTRSAHPAVQLRRLLVAAASAGTGFLLLSALGYALGHPDAPAGSLLLRLAWCAAPLAATVHFAVAVARTDPATAPRPGLAAIGLGPARLMAVSTVTTALATTLGSMLALLFFLHLRGDLTGLPFDGAAAEFLAADQPLPLPATLTLLASIPTTASLTVAFTLRPQDPRPKTPHRHFGRFGAFGGRTRGPETFGTYGRFGSRAGGPRATGGVGGPRAVVPPAAQAGAGGTPPGGTHAPAADGTSAAGPGSAPGLHGGTPGTAQATAANPTAALPWGIATLAAGLAAEAYAGRTAAPTDVTMPGGLGAGPLGVLVGWALTAVGLALAGPGLTHLCGRLLQAARPGALRLLAGRALMAESGRIGRPLGVVCAVASAGYALAVLQDQAALGPLTTLGAFLVAGCTTATLLTAAVEARQVRADTTAALLRLGAPATVLRGAAVLRAGALLTVFGPLTLLVAALAAQPLAR
jgi:hypothetical protein